MKKLREEQYFCGLSSNICKRNVIINEWMTKPKEKSVVSEEMDCDWLWTTLFASCAALTLTSDSI